MSRGDHPAGRADVPDTLVRPDEVRAFMGRYSGMTIREAFAMAAMQGSASRYPDSEAGYLARRAVLFADALLDELQKERTP